MNTIFLCRRWIIVWHIWETHDKVWKGPSCVAWISCPHADILLDFSQPARQSTNSQVKSI